MQISVRTARDLASRHGLHAEELTDALVCVAGLSVSWGHDPERGPRAVVETNISGARFLVDLYPVEGPMGEDWRLGSVYPIVER